MNFFLEVHRDHEGALAGVLDIDSGCDQLISHETAFGRHFAVEIDLLEEPVTQAGNLALASTQEEEARTRQTA